MSTINDLPNEVLSKIFSLLYRSYKYECLLVNRRFYSVAVLELWKSITINGHENDRTARCFSLFCIRIGERVKRLTLGYGPHHHQLVCILSYLPNLEELVLSNTPSLIEQDVLQIPNLPIESLTIHKCDWITSIETALHVRSFSNLIQLDVDFRLSGLAKFLRIITIDEAGIPYLPRLQYLSMGSRTLQGDDLDTAIISFLKTHPRIRYLKLRFNQISNIVFDAIICHLPDLETFLVYEPISISAKSIRKIVYHCPKLLYVQIDHIRSTEYDFPEVHHRVRHHRLTLGYNDLKHIRANQYADIIND
ncbi:hypothetical protein RO3G_12255 [Rhizopus delemar RA 99-880]|uniref:F-box domain-containing protein n=1 Tax=Rhizopus delemar (strain RA 99-880 / ATCC MYA-4621 / FGSC 9543 / NRRL 43880) TaxID=246409 RepID=I1CGG4_RHIO9|nr:hypothetical protein RO3G_12255 [Rhizopus delemar RA 99-880]|eukprot:EIE87544.1 hypothetical protein RO3G_12255 [Rhizopus delemar RA 99-880]